MWGCGGVCSGNWFSAASDVLDVVLVGLLSARRLYCLFLSITGCHLHISPIAVVTHRICTHLCHFPIPTRALYPNHQPRIVARRRCCQLPSTVAVNPVFVFIASITAFLSLLAPPKKSHPLYGPRALHTLFILIDHSSIQGPGVVLLVTDNCFLARQFSFSAWFYRFRRLFHRTA